MVNESQQKSHIPVAREETFIDVFFKYLYIILKYKVLISIITVSVIPLTLIVLKKREPEFTPLYKTTARLRIIAGLDIVAKNTLRNSEEESTMYRAKAESISRLMQSSVILENVVKKVYNLADGDREKIEYYFKLLRGREDEEEEDVYYGGNLTLKPELNYIKITVVDPSPNAAMGIMDNLIEATRQETLNSQKQIAKETMDSFEKELDSVRQELESSKLKLTKFIVENKMVSKIIELAERSESGQESKEKKTNFFESDTDVLAIKLVEIRSEISKKEDFLKKIEQLRSSTGDIDTYKLLERERENLTNRELIPLYIKLYKKVEDLLLVNKEEHPDVLRAREELTSMQKYITGEIDSTIETLKREIDALNNREEDMTALINEGLSNVMVEYSYLKRNVMIKQQLAEKALEALQEFNLVNKLISSTATFTIVDAPTMPTEPFNMHEKARTLINRILFSIIFSLGTGIAAVVLVDNLRMVVKDMAEVEEALDMRILGELPLYGKPKLDEKRIPSLPLVEEPRAIVSEAFRGLRTNIKFSTMDREVKTLLITSLIPKEGKTFVSSNLAVAFAQTDKKVLIIDCDLRKSTLSEYFGLENKEGMAQLLEGKTGIKPVSKGIPNLSILVAGRHPQHPAELLGSDAFDKVIDMFKQEYDLIIIDSPPIFAVADSTLLMKKVDASILVTRAGVTPKKALRRAARITEDVRSKIIGVVFNGIESRIAGYGSYYYYQYDYYGKKKEDEHKA